MIVIDYNTTADKFWKRSSRLKVGSVVKDAPDEEIKKMESERSDEDSCLIAPRQFSAFCLCLSIFVIMNCMIMELILCYPTIVDAHCT